MHIKCICMSVKLLQLLQALALASTQEGIREKTFWISLDKRIRSSTEEYKNEKYRSGGGNFFKIKDSI